MFSVPNANDARIALHAIELQRQQVVAMIKIPWWYWWSVAIGWIALGVVTDLGSPWATGAGTLVFGAAHASVAWRVIDGRHGSRQLSIRRNLVSRHVPYYVLGGLIVLAVLTGVFATVFSLHHVGHPVTSSSVLVAIIVVIGGPGLMAALRRHASQKVTS
ncbi:MAG: hypothetical protein ABI298_09155 [Acidimicrobiales bacterium]